MLRERGAELLEEGKGEGLWGCMDKKITDQHLSSIQAFTLMVKEPPVVEGEPGPKTVMFP